MGSSKADVARQMLTRKQEYFRTSFSGYVCLVA